MLCGDERIREPVKADAMLQESSACENDNHQGDKGRPLHQGDRSLWDAITSYGNWYQFFLHMGCNRPGKTY